MFGFILKFLIVFYIICGYLCINKKKRKNFCFFLIFLGLLKRKLIKKSFNLMYCDILIVYLVIVFEKL